MATSTHGETKMRQLLSLIRYWSQQQQQGSLTNSEQHLHPRSPGILRTSQLCTAKGSGLVMGLVGKRCKFDIYTPIIEHVDLHVEIKGPNEDHCSEQITASTLRRHTSQVLSSEDIKKLPLNEANVSIEGDKIPLDCQCDGEGHFRVSYLPRSEGSHYVSIRWKANHIRGSPFNVTVAGTLEKLNMESKNKMRQKQVSFSDDESHQRKYCRSLSSMDPQEEDEDKENTNQVLANVTAAVLNRSSKVHRSISTTAPAGKLSKQATVMRRRVLRRVITKGGQEIVIQEVAASPTSSRQSSNDMSRQSSMDLSRQSSLESSPFSRPDSPVNSVVKKSRMRHNKSFDFEMVCEFDVETDQSSSPGMHWAKNSDDSAGGIAGSLVSTVMDDVFHMLQMKEVKEKLLKGQHLVTRRPDHHKPVSPTRSLPYSLARSQNVTAIHCDSDTRSSFDALLSKSGPVQTDQSSILTVSPGRHQWPGQRDGSPTRDSDSKGNTITPSSIICSLQRNAMQQRMNKELSVSDEDTDINLHKKLNATRSIPLSSNSSQNAHAKLSATASVPTRMSYSLQSLAPPSLGKLFDKERMPSQLESVTEASREHSVEGSGSIHGSRCSSFISVEQDKCDADRRDDVSDCEAPARKLSKGDTFPPGKMPLKKTLSDPTKSRSKRLGLQRSHTSPSSPNHEPFSRSLAEQCAAIISPENILQRLNNPAIKANSVSSDHLKSLGGSQDLSDHSYQEDRPMLWKTRRLAHRLSSSLPTLSRNWTAFDIDPDDDSLTIEEMEALSVAAQRRPKRATLGDLDSDTFNKLNSSVDEGFGADCDMLMIPYNTHRFNSMLSPTTDLSPLSLHTVSPLSLNASPSDSKISSRRGSLLRQEMTCLQKVSEESQDSEKLNEDLTNSHDTLMDHYYPRNKQTSEGSDPWSMTNTPEFISRRKSLEPENRMRGDRQYVKVPIPKMDRWTQVAYDEIKQTTGWTKPATYVHPRRRMVRKEAIETFSSEESQGGRNSTDITSGVPRIIYSDGNDCGRELDSEEQSSGYLSSLTRRDNGLQIPVRQSTVDTVDSGIADSPQELHISPPSSLPVKNRPHFIAGHRAVTRSRYRGNIPLDPRLVSSSPTTSCDDESTRFPHKKTMPRYMRYSRSISETRKYKHRGTSRDDSETDDRQRHRLRMVSTKRRVRFSRKVMLFRRSSSRSSRSPRSRELSHEGLTPSPVITSDLVPILSQLAQQQRSTLTPDAYRSPVNPERLNQSENISFMLPLDTCNSKERNNGSRSNQNNIADENPNMNLFFADYFTQLDSERSREDKSAVPNHWTVGHSVGNTEHYDEDGPMETGQGQGQNHSLVTEGAPGVNSESFTFYVSQDCSGSDTTCSEIVNLTSQPCSGQEATDLMQPVLQDSLRQPRPSISIEDEVFSPTLASLISGQLAASTPLDVHSDMINVTSGSQPSEMHIPYQPEHVDIHDDLNLCLEQEEGLTLPRILPDPYRCKAIGAGLNFGQVGVKNNFQVL